jgi:hypothetical protein
MSGAISSGLPLSSIRKSENIVISPLGALVTWQIFPKPSRYCLIGTGGSRRMASGVMRSLRLIGWTLNSTIIGVGCGQS